MSKRELVRLVNELEQAKVDWKNYLTSKGYEYVVLRIGIGIKPHSKSEISKKLWLPAVFLYGLESESIYKLQKLIQQDSKTRSQAWFYLRFVESLSQASLKNLRNIVFLFDNFYSSPIETLSLSSRTYNMIRRAGICTIGDIFEEGLEDIKNVGVKSIEEIRVAIYTLIN